MNEVRTARLTLRPVGVGDRAEFVRVYAASWEAWRAWMPALAMGETFDDLFDRMLARTTRELGDGSGRPLAGFLDDGRIAGFFAISNIVRGAFQSGYAGWRVSAEVMRQGYGLEGLTALLDVAFAADGLALHRVQANVIPENVASLKLAERAGFRREGLATGYLKIAGRWQDHVMMAKLVDEHQRERGDLGGRPA